MSLLEVNLIEILKYSRVTEVVVPKDNKSSQRKALCCVVRYKFFTDYAIKLSMWEGCAFNVN